MAKWRLLILLAAMTALVAGVMGGLARFGLDLPLSQAMAFHGALMAGGFLGTLISLERAISLSRLWAFIPPVLSATAGLLFLGQRAEGFYVLTAASLAFVLVSATLARRHPVRHYAVMLLGACAWLIGNVLASAGHAIPEVVGWWMAFLVLTIVGERLELGCLLPSHQAKLPFFDLAIALYVAGIITVLPLLHGIGLLAVSLWLFAFDPAPRELRQPGLPRHMAVTLLIGYAWLGVCGLMTLLDGPYDARLHTLFLGFVFAMIFAHAPLIFPAVAGRALPFHAGFYLPVGLMQVGLVLRFGGEPATGGIINALSLLLFVLNVVFSAFIKTRRTV